MNVTSTFFTYRAFGFDIQSEFFLPELKPTKINLSFPKIEMIRSILQKTWTNLPNNQELFYVMPNYCMFKVPEVAIFLIRDGSVIEVEVLQENKEDHIRLFILGTCMGALLMQRKILPLHGSAIAVNGSAYAIVGDSGAGKSTTASALMQKGYHLISDDVIPVSLNSNGIPIVSPAYPQQKLWNNSLQELGLDASEYQSIADREEKYSVPVLSHFTNEALPLAGIFELTTGKGECMGFSEIQGLKRIHTLFKHTYRNFFLLKSGGMEWHFQMTAKMAKMMDFHQIERPKTTFTADEISDLILHSVARKEEVKYG